MKILLIVHYFPPLNQIGSLRAAHWAKYWATAGVEVHVLTTRKHPEDTPLDLCMHLPATVKIWEVDYDLAPVYRFAKRLEARPTQGQSLSPTRQHTTGSPLRLIRKTILTALGSLASPTLLWYRRAVVEAARLLNIHQYQVLLSSFYPPVTHLVANTLKKRHPSLFWVADFRDLWVENPITQAHGPFAWLENILENATVGKHANLLVTVSEPLADTLAARHRKPVLIVENGFDPEEFPGWESQLLSTRFAAASRPKPRIISYTGTIYPQYRDPTPLFKAIKHLFQSGHLTKDDLRITFLGARLDRVLELARSEGVESCVLVEGHVSRPHALRVQAESSALLLLGDDQPQSRGVLTGKIFEYLVSGRPILAIGFAPDSSVDALLKNTGTGLNCGKDIARIASFLVELVQTGSWQGFRPQVDTIRQYSRAEQAKRLLDVVVQECQKTLRGCPRGQSGPMNRIAGGNSSPASRGGIVLNETL